MALPAMTIDSPMSQIATDPSPEEVERYGARGYGIPLQMPRQRSGSAIDDRVIESDEARGCAGGAYIQPASRYHASVERTPSRSEIFGA